MPCCVTTLSRWSLPGPHGVIWTTGPTRARRGRRRTLTTGAGRLGQAQLGYGDGDETTVVGFGPNELQKHITTYFRHVFTLQDTSRFTGLTLDLLRDDGAAVYLNGVEIARDLLPVGAAYSDTALPVPGPVDGEDDAQFHSFQVDPRLLIQGRNVLAVEVHQGRPTSDDLSFDLRLRATQTRPAVELPLVPDVDEYSIDLTGLVGKTIDIVLAGAGTADFTGQSLQLLDPTYANVLATASPSVGETPLPNHQLAILGFVVPQDGIYPIRLTSLVDGQLHAAGNRGGHVRHGTERRGDRLSCAVSIRRAALWASCRPAPGRASRRTRKTPSASAPSNRTSRASVASWRTMSSR